MTNQISSELGSRTGNRKEGSVEKLEKWTRWAAIILILAAGYYIVYPALKKLYWETSHVMPYAEKMAMFNRIQAKGFFVGKEGKRPALCVRDIRGKLEFDDGKDWIKI